MRTALAVRVPEAEPVVGQFRARFAAPSVARRIPAHVTIVFPFVPLADVVRAWGTLTELTASIRSFEASLAGVDRFERHVWLTPEPKERWVAMIEQACAALPAMQPYEGAFDEHVPHLTVGEAGDGVSTEAIAEAARRELGPQLPVRFRVRALSLFEERPDGSWSVGTELPLALPAV